SELERDRSGHPADRDRQQSHHQLQLVVVVRRRQRRALDGDEDADEGQPERCPVTLESGAPLTRHVFHLRSEYTRINGRTKRKRHPQARTRPSLTSINAPIVIAAWISPTCVYACGKLPSSWQVSGSTSSENRPSGFACATTRSNTATASSSRPA